MFSLVTEDLINAETNTRNKRNREEKVFSGRRTSQSREEAQL
jgi:hypothetical protein